MLKMNKTSLVCLLLIAIMILGVAGCATVVIDTGNGDLPVSEIELGAGDKQFILTVNGGDGGERVYRINTDKEIVGEALLELKVIEGEEGPYGMYIKTVDGITADYNDGGKYWAFYINGEYATSGVDTTEIEEGAVYSLKIQR